MDHRPLARWRACFALGDHIWRARRGVRATRRAHGCTTLAPPISRTYALRSDPSPPQLLNDPRSTSDASPINIALDAPRHAGMAHRGPHPHGYMHRQALDMRHCRVRDGEPVSHRQHYRVRHRHEPLLVCALDYPPDRDRHRKYPFETMANGGGTRLGSASDQAAGRLRGTSPGTHAITHSVC